MTQTVPDISPLMPMHQDPLLVNYFGAINSNFCIVRLFPLHSKSFFDIPDSSIAKCSLGMLGLKSSHFIKWGPGSSPKGDFCPRTYKCRQGGHHDDVIKRKHFPRYWPFVRGIHRSLVNSLYKGQCRGALMFSLICAWIIAREAGDLRRHRAHYDVTVMANYDCRYQSIRKKGGQPLKTICTPLIMSKSLCLS